MFDDSEQLMIIWRQYLADHDRGSLVAAAMANSDAADALSLFLWLAAGLGDWQLVKQLEESGAALPSDDTRPGGLILHALSDFGDAATMVEWLVKRGARVGDRGPNDWTPLHFACRQGYSCSAQILVDHGAEVNARTSTDGGWTPLMEACAVGNKAIVEMLLARGADVTAYNSYEVGTAREIALKKNHRDIVSIIDQRRRGETRGQIP